MKRVRIFGTLGPACSDPKTLEQMLLEGMDGVRLNLSHTTLEEAADLIDAFHKAAEACGRKPELLIDMQGPELRLGTLVSRIELNPRATIDADALPFPAEVRTALDTALPGQEILLDDGKILLIKEDGDRLRTVRGGVVQSKKSIALPGITIPTPAMTDADRTHIGQAVSFGVTGVMQPFVRSKEDLIEDIKQALEEI